jgi:uncharacterized damage-inducible protein DinB
MHFICGLLYLCDNTQMESSRIADQLRRSIHGEAWHGPSVMELLNDVDWRQAAAKPIAGAHSIWEIVLHIAAWADAAERRSRGKTVELTPAEDWPPVTDASEESWRTSVRTLGLKQESLAGLAAALTDEQLEATAAGEDYSVYFLLHGVVQHNLYHAGQIALLKKR